MLTGSGQVDCHVPEPDKDEDELVIRDRIREYGKTSVVFCRRTGPDLTHVLMTQ